MPPHMSVSNLLGQIHDHAMEKETLSLEECLRPTATYGIPMALLVVSLLGMMPFSAVPGFSAIIGAAIGMLGFALCIGKPSLHLPHRIMEKRIHTKKLLSLLQRIIPLIRRMEILFAPHWPRLSKPPGRNMLGLACMLLALLLSLPLPLTNFPLSLASALLAMGLLLEDGRVILAGYMVMALTIGMILLLVFEFL